MEQLEAFVRAVESVDPRVTGHPVQTYYASRHMQHSYIRAGLYALGRRARSAVDRLPQPGPFAARRWCRSPSASCRCAASSAGSICRLNPANMIVLPLMLGIGVDHGVHLVHLWRQQRGRFALGDAPAVALLLTAATTTASFGALILARHQGLQSLGQVLTLGVTTCLASSIIFFPALLTWLDSRRSVRSISVPACAETADSMAAKKHETAVPAPVDPTPPAEVAEQHPLPVIAAPLQPPEPTVAPIIPIELPQLLPAPVTDEEIAALLETAFHPRFAAPSEDETAIDLPADDALIATPRRRNLPRRSEAA